MGCRSDSECSATQRCNTSTGRCEARPTGGAELGQPCEANDDCNSGLCATTAAGSVCSQSCDGFNTTSCPAGFYCDGEASGVCGTGLCLAGAAGAAPLGATCAADTDCASLMCDGTVCSTPCRPDASVSACAMGFVCRPGAAPGCGACRSEADLGQPGDACGINEDCASGLCAVLGDQTFCTEICSETDPCPESFTCTPLGDGGTAICVPPASRTRDDGGCGCATPGAGGTPSAPWLLALAGLALALRRSRR
jgi:MYXO-CTERM domain-containing protein